ncbi:MAG: hypothetical protein Q9181_004594 [Wetmoreana brouardii]
MAGPKSASPPLTTNVYQEFDDGFDKLVQHNATTSYQPGPFQTESNAYQQSASSTTYNSPEPRHVLLEQYDQRYYQGGVPSYYDGLPVGVYGSSHGGMMYPNPPSAYQAMPSAQANYTTSPYQFGSSHTPEPSDQGDRNKRTRNGRSMPPGGSPSLGDGSQGSNSPGPKRAVKKSKSEAVGEASISAPLSQLCLDVPVVDVYEKVNRSIEERQEEARKDNKIKRPSNSFMLYRSAYGDRVKALYPQNNHQIISRICGASWKMETPDVTEKFKAYYEMEKENHAKAHPTYKFSPAKSSPNRKRRGTGDTSDEEDDGSEPGDFDSEYRPRGGRRSRPAKTPRTGTPTSYPANQANPVMGGYQPALIHANMGGYLASTWQVSNPGKPMPAPMDPYLPEGVYYQTSVQQRGPNVEDVFIHRTQVPRSQPPASQALIGLPGASHEELLGTDSAGDSPSPQVDPLLLNYDGELPGQAGGFAHDQDFQDFDHQGLYEGRPQTDGHANGTQYQSTFDPWQVNGEGGDGEGDLDWLK